MSPKKIRRLILLNAAIIIFNIALFSKAFLGLALFTGAALTVGIAWAAIAASAFAFVKGNSQILKKEETRFLVQNIHTLNDCVPVFQEAIHNGDVFDDDIKKNIDQIARFRRKQDTIKDILLQKFTADEMSYKKFAGVLQEVENVIYLNMRSALNKIAAFDYREYEAIKRGGVVGDEPQAREKMAIYNEYIGFVNNASVSNEDILLKLDKMLLEISRYNSLEDGDVQKLPAIVEMDELIKNAGLYK